MRSSATMKASIRAKLDAPVPEKVALLGKKSHRRMKLLDKELEAAAPADKIEILSIERMMVLRISGLTYDEVGAVMGCSGKNVLKRLTPYRDTIDGLREFQDNKADFYDACQSRILTGLSDAKIEDAKLFDLIRSASTLEDMGRKVRGLDAHKNINVFSITVKAAFPVPGRKEVVIEGSSSSLRGTGIPEDVCEGVLPAVPRDRQCGDVEEITGSNKPTSTFLGSFALPVFEEGRDFGA